MDTDKSLETLKSLKDDELKDDELLKKLESLLFQAWEILHDNTLHKHEQSRLLLFRHMLCNCSALDKVPTKLNKSHHKSFVIMNHTLKEKESSVTLDDLWTFVTKSWVLFCRQGIALDCNLSTIKTLLDDQVLQHDK